MPREIDHPQAAWSEPQNRPDWVILGSPNGDGSYTVLASAVLDSAELNVRREAPYSYLSRHETWADPLSLLDRSITLKVEMEDFVAITASSYAACLRALFEDWTPAPAQRLAIQGTGKLT
jgi:hypothetical protein